MSNIADKIRKLIAKADSTTHPEEAATFMEKAQSLMLAHGLSLLDLGRLDAEDPVGTDRDGVVTKVSYDWARKVVFEAGFYFGVTAVEFKRSGGYHYSLVGRESARVTAALMIPFIVRQLSQAAGKGVKDGVFPNRRVAHKQLSSALVIRLSNERSRADTSGRGMNALVPVDMVALEVEAQFPTAKKLKSARLETSRAAMEIAKGIRLNMQASATAAKRLA